SGNYGLPVSQLVFQGNPLGMTVQIIIMAIQNFITYTYGLLNLVSVKHRGSQAILEFFKMPMLYALVLGLLFQSLKIEIPGFLWNPIENISNAFLAIALLSLGAQVAFTKITRLNRVIVASTVGRLIAAPVIAYLLILLMGLTGTIAKGVFI